MDRQGANEVYKMLKVYYPRVYRDDVPPEKAKAFVDDFEESYKPYPNELVLQMLKEWHYESNQPPTVADIRHALIEANPNAMVVEPDYEESKGPVVPMPDSVRDVLRDLGISREVGANDA